MREIEASAGPIVAGGAGAPNTTLLFAEWLPAYEYLPVIPAPPLAGIGVAA